MIDNVTVAPPISTVLVEDGESLGGIVPEENAGADEVQAEAEAPREEALKATIYMGPSLDKIVQHGTIFADGTLPGILEAKIKEVPAIRGLIVPFEQCAQVARAVTLPDGRYRMLYDMVQGTAVTR